MARADRKKRVWIPEFSGLRAPSSRALLTQPVARALHLVRDPVGVKGDAPMKEQDPSEQGRALKASILGVLLGLVLETLARRPRLS